MNSKRKKRVTIPPELTEVIQPQIEIVAREYNRELTYRIKQSYVYFDAEDDPICRCKYTGDINDWEFALFKWSTESYSTTDEFGFSFRGTIQECVESGVKAYPKRETTKDKRFYRFALLMLFLGIMVSVLAVGIFFKVTGLWRKYVMSDERTGKGQAN